MNHEDATIAYHNALQRIDDEWQEERQRYLERRRGGPLHEPDLVTAVICLALFFAVLITLLIVVFSIVRQIAAGEISPPMWSFVCLMFWTLFSVFLGWLAVLNLRKAMRFRQARNRYRERQRNVRLEDFLNRGKSDAAI